MNRHRQFRPDWDSISRERRMSRILSTYDPNEQHLHDLGEGPADDDEERPRAVNVRRRAQQDRRQP